MILIYNKLVLNIKWLILRQKLFQEVKGLLLNLSIIGGSLHINITFYYI